MAFYMTAIEKDANSIIKETAIHIYLVKLTFLVCKISNIKITISTGEKVTLENKGCPSIKEATAREVLHVDKRVSDNIEEGFSRHIEIDMEGASVVLEIDCSV